jgi:hypothetical protein
LHRTQWIFALALCGSLALWSCETNRPADAQGTVGTTTKEATKAPPAKDVAAEGNYKVALGEVDLKAGEAGKVTIVVTPKTGFKVNKEFPWRAALTGGAGMTVPTDEQGTDKWKLTDKEGTLELPVTLAEAGEKDLKGKLNFSVCNDDRCDVIRDHEVSFKIAAK